MFYVHPLKPKSALRARMEAPMVFLTILWLHPRNGFRYAYYWARQSVVNREGNGGAKVEVLQ